jgi:hypothetical protein
MAYFAGILGLIMWRFHKSMRLVRYAILFALISLHMLMKAPVWYLMAKVGSLTGGASWHRSYIIDMAIKYFKEWWLFGTKDTTAWMPYHLPSSKIESFATSSSSATDITNQFILEGVEGGFFSMLLFIIIIILCFRQIGILLQLNENQPFSKRIILWSLGASLFANVVAMFSCSYFDQLIFIWFLLLAMISSTCIQKQDSADFVSKIN